MQRTRVLWQQRHSQDLFRSIYKKECYRFLDSTPKSITISYPPSFPKTMSITESWGVIDVWGYEGMSGSFDASHS